MFALRYLVVQLVLEDNSVSLFSGILIVSLTVIDFLRHFTQHGFHQFMKVYTIAMNRNP